jgi:bacteriophage N4 adsorption protein A
MIRYLLLALLIFSSLTVCAQEWHGGLTELQRFRTYPHVDKAFQFQRQQQYAAAAAQVERALEVVPGHVPLLKMLFDYQLAAANPTAALRTYQLIPASQREDKLLRLVQTQLSTHQVLDLDDYSSLLTTLPASQQQQVQFLITQHLIAEQQLQRAFTWLLQQSELSDKLRLQRAELASQLSMPQQVILDTEAVPTAALTEQDWQRYTLALLSQGNGQKAAVLANKYADADWAAWFYRQWLQMQLSQADWHAAEHSFSWLDRYKLLTDAEQMQRYQAAINRQDTHLAARLVPQLQVNCLDKVAMYLQSDAQPQAKAHFTQCPPQSTLQWLNYAERWMSASALEAVVITDKKLAQQQADMVSQKRIAAQDYLSLLQRKFSQPLKQRDYEQLVASINELPDAATQLQYFTKLYQAMPNDYLLDRLSYLYIEQHQPEQAMRVLDQALPFSAAAMQQHTLPNRLINLLQQLPNWQTPAMLNKLESWQQFTAARAELWRLVGNCQQAEQLLAPAPDSTEGWRTLALCANTIQPGAAIQYWQQAYQLQPDPAYLKHIAYQNLLLQQPETALAQFSALPANTLLPEDLLMMAELSLQNNKVEQAAQYLKQVQSSRLDEQARLHAIQAAVYSQQQQPKRALESWQQAAALQPEKTDYQLGYAYALAATEPEHALQIMQWALAQAQQITAAQAAQMAFLNQRLQYRLATQQWAGTALQLYQQQANPTDTELNTQFSMLRLKQQLSSHWQLSSSATVTSGAVNTNRLVAERAEVSRYGVAVKAEYFFDPLLRDFSLYALLAGNGSSSPWQNWGQQLGISYKPWQQLNIWLSAGLQQYPLAEGDWQSVLRISADLLNAAPWQAEWRPVPLDWWERKLYVDAVWWPETGNQQAQARFEQGPVWKLDTASAQTLKWYGLSQFDYRRQATDLEQSVNGAQLTAGMGLQWRYWPGQIPVLLRRQRLEVNLEWQYQLAGNLNQRQHALLLQFYLAW